MLNKGLGSVKPIGEKCEGRKEWQEGGKGNGKQVNFVKFNNWSWRYLQRNSSQPEYRKHSPADRALLPHPVYSEPLDDIPKASRQGFFCYLATSSFWSSSKVQLSKHWYPATKSHLWFTQLTFPIKMKHLIPTWGFPFYLYKVPFVYELFPLYTQSVLCLPTPRQIPIPLLSCFLPLFPHPLSPVFVSLPPLSLCGNLLCAEELDLGVSLQFKIFTLWLENVQPSIGPN